MTLLLPPPIAAYFTASNAANPEDLAEAFAPDGEVRDERQTHRGRDAIIAWARAAQQRYGMQAAALAIEQVGDDYKVTARITGDFPGSPLDLTHRFRLSQAGVLRLEIG